MAWIDIKSGVVADTVRDNGELVAKDTSFTIGGIEFVTADVQAMGNLTVPLIGLLENMALAITKIGLDRGLGTMSKLEAHNFEFRWVQNVVREDGSQNVEGCKAFVRTLPATTPELGVEVGSVTETEHTYNITRVQLFVNGEELYCVDRLAQTLRILGVDYMEPINNLL